MNTSLSKLYLSAAALTCALAWAGLGAAQMTPPRTSEPPSPGSGPAAPLIGPRLPDRTTPLPALPTFPALGPLLGPTLPLNLPAAPTTAEPAPVPVPETPSAPAEMPSLPAPAPALPSLPSAPAAPTPTPMPPPTPTPQPAGELRGLWVDGFGAGLKSRAQVTQLVIDAQRLGINTLFVQAIRRADCLCRRASVPLVADRDLESGFDPLAEAIAQAHARHIRVFAWVSVTGAGSAPSPNPSPQHVLAQHGPTAAQSWVNRRADGSYLEGNDIWLDAGNPDASEYMAQMLLSLVKNYDVDGLQFDRIRYPDGGDWGYTPVALARFRTETGARGIPQPSDPVWSEWKREQITALVRRVSLEARLRKPQLWISAATITYGAPPADPSAFDKTRTYSGVYQDWPSWTQSGLLDLNVLMNYKQDLLPNHLAWFDGWNHFALKVAGRAEVAAGTALYLNTPSISRAQMQRSLGMGLSWVGYAYRNPTPAVYQGKQSLTQGLEDLRQALNLSASTWQQLPPERYGLLGHLRGAVPGWREVEVLDASGQKVAQGRSDGNGYYGFADLGPGTYEVRVAGQRWIETLRAPGVARLPDMLLREVKEVKAMPPGAKER